VCVCVCVCVRANALYVCVFACLLCIFYARIVCQMSYKSQPRISTISTTWCTCAKFVRTFSLDFREFFLFVIRKEYTANYEYVSVHTKIAGPSAITTSRGPYSQKLISILRPF
jgi:hypothetical protein